LPQPSAVRYRPIHDEAYFPIYAELERRGDDDEAVAAYGIEYATRQCEELLREGAPGLHFYTLNKARSTTEVVKNLALERLAFGEAATI